MIRQSKGRKETVERVRCEYKGGALKTSAGYIVKAGKRNVGAGQAVLRA